MESVWEEKDLEGDMIRQGEGGLMTEEVCG